MRRCIGSVRGMHYINTLWDRTVYYREVSFIQRSSMEYTGGRTQVKGGVPGSSELCRPQTQSLSPDQSVVQYTKTVNSLANVVLGALRLRERAVTYHPSP